MLRSLWEDHKPALGFLLVNFPPQVLKLQVQSFVYRKNLHENCHHQYRTAKYLIKPNSLPMAALGQLLAHGTLGEEVDVDVGSEALPVLLFRAWDLWEGQF